MLDVQPPFIGRHAELDVLAGAYGAADGLLGRKVYKNLADHAQALGVDESIPWLMIGRGGVTPAVSAAEPHVRGYTIEDLYH